MLPNGFVKIPKKELPLLAREEAKKALTIVPSNDPLNPIHLWEEEGNVLAIPRGYFREINKRFQPHHEFHFSLGANTIAQANEITYRDGQKEIIDQCLDVLLSEGRKSFSGVILEAKTGSGKTICCLEMARRLNNKTLVVVHTTVLLKQWQEEIRNIMPTWSCGLIQESVCDVDNNDICIGMLHTLAFREYDPSFYDQFGTVIIDEVDRVASEEFHKVFKKFAPQFIVGVTGTLKRSDGTENLIRHCIGPVVSAVGKMKALDPTIYFIDTRFFWKPGDEDLKNHILTSAERNELIVSNVEKAALSGRHVLVLTIRVPHAENIYRSLIQRLSKRDISVGIMIGETEENIREIHKSAQVIVATSQLISVGFNNPRLDTLVFAYPPNEVVQPIGRILREHPEKKKPMVIDIVDTQNIMAFRAAKKRKDEYLSKGWRVEGGKFLG